MLQLESLDAVHIQIWGRTKEIRDGIGRSGHVLAPLGNAHGLAGRKQGKVLERCVETRLAATKG
jgi:hypothetical protein